MLDNRCKGLIRALLYPVQFERQPEAGVARVLRQVVAANALSASPQDYQNAIALALQSDEKLSALIPQPHGEQKVRNYLSAMQDAIRHQTVVQASAPA